MMCVIVNVVKDDRVMVDDVCVMLILCLGSI